MGLGWRAWILEQRVARWPPIEMLEHESAYSPRHSWHQLVTDPTWLAVLMLAAGAGLATGMASYYELYAVRHSAIPVPVPSGLPTKLYLTVLSALKLRGGVRCGLHDSKSTVL